MQVKGILLQSIPIFIQRTHGSHGYTDFLNSLSAESREIFETPIRVSRWYPAQAAVIAPTLKICELFYNNDSIGAFESGRFSAAHALRGIYKPMVKIGTVGWLIQRSSRMAKLYYDAAESSALKHDPKDWSYFLTQKNDVHEVLERRLQGWLHKAFEISYGEPTPINIVQAQSKGDPATEYRVSWG